MIDDYQMHDTDPLPTREGAQNTKHKTAQNKGSLGEGCSPHASTAAQ
jgi:hypothetical protein